MKRVYKVKLYRSPILKTILGVILVIDLLYIICATYLTYRYFSEGNTFYALFFQQSVLFRTVEVPMGFIAILEYILFYVFGIAIAYTAILILCGNRILVYDDYIEICFPPRSFRRIIYKKNIKLIAPANANEVTFFEKLFNFNFYKKNLYKIFYYDYVFIITCKDEQLNRLIQETNRQSGDGSVIDRS